MKGRSIYLSPSEQEYLKALLEAQDEHEFEGYEAAKYSLMRKLEDTQEGKE